MSPVVTHGRIAGVVAAVPSNVWSNADVKGADEAARITGIHSRRRVWADMTTESMMCRAAERLLSGLAWAPQTIDVLVVVTQTPSSRAIPASAYDVHRELHLSDRCLVMQINWSCAGYVNGLLTAMKMVSPGGRALLLVADAMTPIIDQNDRATAPVFGDAGSATAIENGSHYTHKFVYGSDGVGNDALCQPHGGKLHMDGAEVFNFSLDRVPSLIEELLRGHSDPDVMLFHQANKFMLDHLVKKCRLRERYPNMKIPSNLAQYGNCSSASIPLLMCWSFPGDGLRSGATVAMIGFGAGWAWSGALIDLNDITLVELMEI